MLPGFRTGALGFLTTLLELAETSSKSGIADSDCGARIADAVGLQSHRGRIVGGESAHQSRRQHGARDRFQFAAPRFLFRRRDLQRLKMFVYYERNLDDAARQPAVRRTGSEFPVRQCERLGRSATGEKESETSDSFALKGKRMSAREHRLTSPRRRDPAAAIDRNLQRPVVDQSRAGGSFGPRWRSRDFGVQIELCTPQLLACQRA